MANRVASKAPFSVYSSMISRTLRKSPKSLTRPCMRLLATALAEGGFRSPHHDKTFISGMYFQASPD